MPAGSRLHASKLAASCWPTQNRDTSDKIPALAFGMERCISAPGCYSAARRRLGAEMAHNKIALSGS